MAQLPPHFQKMLSAPGIRPQVLTAVKLLTAAMGGGAANHGGAYVLCNTWQQRFELALRGEVPDWVGLAGFRIITDYTIPPSKVPGVFPPKEPVSADPCPKAIDDFEKCWRAYDQYLIKGRNLYSGKFTLAGVAEDHFLADRTNCDPLLGGQSGNILWLWTCIGARAVGYVPYLSRGLASLPASFPRLGHLNMLRFDWGAPILEPLSTVAGAAGVPTAAASNAPVGAPSGGSITVPDHGRRLILQFPGMRDLDLPRGAPAPWDQVEFRLKEASLGVLKREDSSDVTWPSLPFFCDAEVDLPSRTLVVTLIDPAKLGGIVHAQAVVDYAVLGGMNGLWDDGWLKRDATLQSKLAAALESQLKALSDSGVRIGVELSSLGDPGYLGFVGRLCRDGVIVAMGLNGIDELPEITGSDRFGRAFQLDCDTLPAGVISAAVRPGYSGPIPEYLTYLRARKLARALGVRTLYVHTETLDFILRKEADPGALLRAQLGDMMGKGLVIAALLQRTYGDNWLSQLNQRMPPAVKPEAMVRLWEFANDFGDHEFGAGTPQGAAARDRLLSSGCWLAAAASDYSVAVVPVMWPDVSEGSADDALPPGFNPTGSGDMTFGAFFLLGGL